MTSGVAQLIELTLTLETSLEFSCVPPARKFRSWTCSFHNL